MGKQKIIVVDDQSENLQVLVEILKADYAVIATTSALKAIDLAQVDPKACAILLDVCMPEMDGFTLCEKLKSIELVKDIPVFFITSLTAEEDYKKGFSSGGYDFIQKPFSATLLLNRLQKAIK
ncbi:response regulator [Thalassotalea sp. PLHSN55]|uniref:response regulator n=1 Tax=Thalassotalea sp. PLHSN55 TaxID=3435888 RepID=UPI003F849389